MDDLLRKVGDRVREIRKSRGFSQEELGERSSLHYTYIGKVERGEKNITLESLVKITQALDVSLEEFFSLVDPKSDNTRLNPYILNLFNTNRSVREQEQILRIIEIVDNMLKDKGE
jgi:transcriptional regulator with XRE-family HTH domain